VEHPGVVPRSVEAVLVNNAEDRILPALRAADLDKGQEWEALQRYLLRECRVANRQDVPARPLVDLDSATSKVPKKGP
jgi:hypothetical protein